MGRERFTLHSLGFTQARDALNLTRMPFSMEKRGVLKESFRLDRQRIFDIVKILNKSTKDVLKSCFPEGTKDDVIESLNKLIKFDHAALLVISPIDFVRDWLKQKSFGKAISFPSAIVSERLGVRYLEEGREIPTAIIKAEKPNKRKIEIFVPQIINKDLLDNIVKTDINQELEKHFAFMPRKRINENSLMQLVGIITTNGFSPEGGGINPAEGLTTLYFTRNGEDKKPIRIELICQGQFNKVVENNKIMVV